MANAAANPLRAAVEGVVDEAVLRRLVEEARGTLSAVYGHKGKEHLRQQLKGYNQAARFSPWLVLVDLDRDAECAPPLASSWLPRPARQMCFRVVVRAIEAWLFADSEQLSDFLSVPASRIPRSPEDEPDPKQRMVQLAQQSRNKEIREAMVRGSGQAGTGYAGRLIEFVRDHWRPAVAATRADSLRRCRERLQQLVAGEEE